MAEKCRVQLLFTAALAVVAVPADVDAKANYRVHPGSTELILPVEARNGRIISVSANNEQRVRLEVERPSSTIEYSTTGRVTSTGIQADFGSLGRVDVRLNLLRFGSDPPRKGRCKGRGHLYGRGTYHGTIEFSQVRGVPHVSITRGRVHFERLFRQVCKRQHPQFKPGPLPKLKRQTEEGKLTVRGKTEGRTVRLDATIFALKRNPAQSGGTLRAAVYERHEEIRIARWRGEFFDDSLVMSKRGKEPETIRVDLPEPFAGRALYSHSLGSAPVWAGDLRVNLPGADGIPLAGLGFSATLCRGKVDSCAYGRGFYSQYFAR